MLFPQLTGVDLSLILWNSIAEFTSFGAFVLSDAWGSFVISDNTAKSASPATRDPEGYRAMNERRALKTLLHLVDDG